MSRNPVRLLKALMSWTDGRVKCLVCAQKCGRVLLSCHARLVQRGASSVCNALEPLEPLQFHRRLFAESIYDQDVSDSLCTCWLFALYRCSGSGMSLHVIMCRISQMCRVEAVSTQSPITSRGTGVLCHCSGQGLSVPWYFHFHLFCLWKYSAEDFIHLETSGYFIAIISWQSCVNCDNMPSLEKMKENPKATW